MLEHCFKTFRKKCNLQKIRTLIIITIELSKYLQNKITSILWTRNKIKIDLIFFTYMR